VVKDRGSVQSEGFAMCGRKMGPPRMKVNEGGDGGNLALRMGLVGY